MDNIDGFPCVSWPSLNVKKVGKIGGFPCVSWPSLNGKKGGQHRQVSLGKLAVFEWNERWKT